MRRNWAVGTTAVVGMWAASGCATSVDVSAVELRSEFTSCIEDGGGRVADDFEIAVSDGTALAVVGPGVDASDALLNRCFDVVNP